MTPVLGDGRACLENSVAEREVRPIALGKKPLVRWIQLLRERIAATYSPTGTPKLNGLDPGDYPQRVLVYIADHPVRLLHEPLPSNLPGARTRLDQRRPPERGVAYLRGYCGAYVVAATPPGWSGADSNPNKAIRSREHKHGASHAELRRYRLDVTRPCQMLTNGSPLGSGSSPSQPSDARPDALGVQSRYR